MGNRLAAVVTALSLFVIVPVLAGDVRPPEVKGRVTGEDGAPLAGAVVKVGRVPPGLPVSVPWLDLDERPGTAVGEDGTFSLELPGSGRFFVTASAPGRVSLARILSLGEGFSRAGFDFVLPPGKVLAGTVRDESAKPLAGARILAGPAGPGAPGGEEGPRDRFLARTGDDGTFRIDGVPAGRFRLRVSLDGKATVCLPPVAAGTDDLGIVLPDGEPIGGIVRYPDGSPAAFVSVTVQSDHLVSDLDRTDGEGKFRTEPLPPGKYRVVVRPRRRAPLATPAAKAANCADATVPDVEPGTLNLRIDLRKLAGAKISGRVVDANGRPVPRANVLASRPEAPLASKLSGPTDAEGRFELVDLEEVEYRLRALPPSGESGRIDLRGGKIVKAPAEDVELVVDGGR